MNKIADNIPNLIKQPAQCCIYCGKGYKKKTNFEKHIIICELINRSKRSIIMEDEESIPSHKKMYFMLLELGNKFNKLEEKMEAKIEEMNKFIVKKKKKINVIEWLNSNLMPNINFNNLIEKILVTQDDIDYIFNNSFIDTLNNIFKRNIYIKDESNYYPIVAFIQKSNMFYIYENNDNKWMELSKENIIKFLNKVHMKFVRAFSEYKKQNSDKLRDDESFSILCDKTSIKIMNVDFRQENVLGKVKTNMYSIMKIDMKGLIEYEFEF